MTLTITIHVETTIITIVVLMIHKNTVPVEAAVIETIEGVAVTETTKVAVGGAEAVIMIRGVVDIHLWAVEAGHMAIEGLVQSTKREPPTAGNKNKMVESNLSPKRRFFNDYCCYINPAD